LVVIEVEDTVDVDGGALFALDVGRAWNTTWTLKTG
jgi:hypothetical protein